MDGKRYSIYKLTSPSGRSYVGFTGQTVSERWRQHVNRAKTGAQNPLCAAIRKYGADTFVVETLAEYDRADDALRAEIEAIAAVQNAYNISPGGDFDHGAGRARFVELLSDPEWRAGYSARLSASLRASEAYKASREKVLGALAGWRAANPAKAYLIALRAVRISANRNRKNPKPEAGRIPRVPKGKAAKFHRKIASREAAKKQWATMDPSKKAEVHKRISAALTEHHARKSEADRAEHDRRLAAARLKIDHAVRKARQAEGLKAYWTPERRKAFGDKVRARNAAKKGTQNADV